MKITAKTKKVLLIAVFSVLIATVAIFGYLTVCYFTPVWESPAVMKSTPVDGNVILSKDDRYVQWLGTPSIRTKHNLPVLPKKREQYLEMALTNDAIVKEMATFVSPTFIEVDLKTVGKDTIATYHGNATTKEGEKIEYNKDVVMEGLIFDSVQGYGTIKDTWK